MEVVELLLKHGADPSSQDEDGNAALHLAAELRNIDVVEFLLSGMACFGSGVICCWLRRLADAT